MKGDESATSVSKLIIDGEAIEWNNLPLWVLWIIRKTTLTRRRKEKAILGM